jgi:hypothetical protein
MGRPRLPINWELVDKYLITGADGAAVAAHIKMSPCNFYRAVKKEKGIVFSQYMAEKREIGIMYVEDALFTNAMKGNIVAQIFWLKNKGNGKWSDRTDVRHEGLAPVLNISIDGGADPVEVKMIQNIFNGKVLDTGIPEELGSVQQGSEADSQ